MSRHPTWHVSWDGLSVRQGRQVLLQPQSMRLSAGDRLVVLGESGAGKSLLLKALMGALPDGLDATGQVTLDGTAHDARSPLARRSLWGRSLALLPQEPSVALDPLRAVGAQLAEVHRLVRGLPSAQARQQSQRGLDQLGLGANGALRPWQISGGMAQRACAAMALAGGARWVLADEPTKGLDARWRDRAVDQLHQIAEDGGIVILVTHDLAVARRLGGQLMVMRDGAVLEAGPVDRVLAQPTHAFTRALIASDPSSWTARSVRRGGGVPITTSASASASASAMASPSSSLDSEFGRSPAEPTAGQGTPLVRAEGLGHHWDGHWLFRDVDLSVSAGERIALLGGSGSGKSTLGNLLLGLRPPAQGRVLRAPGLGPLALQKLYQDPVATFAPRQRLGDALEEVRRRHQQSPAVLHDWLAGLRLGPELLDRLPQALSGGQLQRMAMARALLARPVMLFADEPTSRLDLVTQRQTAELLSAAVDQSGAALVLVTHDDALARALTDRVWHMDRWRVEANVDAGVEVAAAA